MDAWLESLVPWGTNVIAWVQSHSAPWLDWLSKAFTTLGDEEFYFVVLPLIYWCIHKSIGIGLAYISLSSAWLNSAVKYLFAIPRPFDPRIEVKTPRLETSPSFPSGHAQNAVANWGYVALWYRNWLFRGLAVVAILGIGLSRVVLGAHFPQDVVGGWLIGTALLAAYAWAEPHIRPWVRRQSRSVQLLLAVGLPVLLVFVHPADASGLYPAQGSITPAGALAGVGLGLVIEQRWVRFEVAGEWWKRLARFLAGIVIVAVLYLGPSLALPDKMPYALDQSLRFLRYGLLGWAVTFLCPWLFVRLRLAATSA